NFFRRTQSVHRLPGRKLSSQRFSIVRAGEDFLEVRGFYRTRGHGIDADPIAYMVQRHRARHGNYGSLRGTVRGPLTQTDQSSDRRGIDDHATTLALHDGNRILAAEEYACH